jgi:hypothetical protein
MVMMAGLLPRRYSQTFSIVPRRRDPEKFQPWLAWFWEHFSSHCLGDAYASICRHRSLSRSRLIFASVYFIGAASSNGLKPEAAGSGRLRDCFTAATSGARSAGTVFDNDALANAAIAAMHTNAVAGFDILMECSFGLT